MTEPEYVAREVASYDSDVRVIKVHRVDAPDDVPDEEKAEGSAGTVTDLALERLRRRQPGSPFTAEELAPLCTGLDAARLLAAALNVAMRPRGPGE